MCYKHISRLVRFHLLQKQIIFNVLQMCCKSNLAKRKKPENPCKIRVFGYIKTYLDYSHSIVPEGLGVRS